MPRRSERAVEHEAANARSWHAMSAEEALSVLSGRAGGLSTAEAERRLGEYGANRLRLKPPVSPWVVLRQQFESIVVGLLGAAAVVAWMMGEALDATAILVVLLVNAAFGFLTELRAQRAMDALRRLEVAYARVLRDGRMVERDAAALVPGDVVEVEAGQAVPADARVLTADDVRVDEALLTGESVPSTKTAAPVAAEAPLAERTSLLFQSTIVATGLARAVVVATGDRTQLGRLGLLTSAVIAPRTPLERRLDLLGRRLVCITLGATAVVGALEVLRGQRLGLAAETAIALAVAAVPEGLPAVATITLAAAVRRMARRNVLVRRLPNVETLGSTTVICTDKTGTLTAGSMAVVALRTAEGQFTVTGTGYGPTGEFRLDGGRVEPADHPLLTDALRIGALANRAALVERDGAWHAVGDPTEAALLAAAGKAGLGAEALRAGWPLLGSVPFDSRRRWMATFHDTPDGAVVLVKGAPQRVLELCAREVLEGGESSLSDDRRRLILAENHRLAERGLRVLALARARLGADEARPLRSGPTGATPEAVHDLTFVGLVGMTDPPAPGVPETIQRFREAGIRTVMITGDQRHTAAAVGRELGLLDEADEVLEGRELAGLTGPALARRLEHAAALCRVSPEEKLQVVEALQEAGEIVAMLGDGVNDAAALKRADVGVAMGRRGTDVAREAATLVLQDDRFPTLGVAIEEGRVIFDNIEKVVFYLFSGNASEVLVFLVAGLVGLPAPLLPLQLLWQNLVTDTFPALALAVEPAEGDVMRRRPRHPGTEILSARFLRRTALFGALLTAVTLAAFVFGLSTGGTERATTLAFATMGLSQIFHLGNARREGHVLRWRGILANPWALGALALVTAMQVLAIEAPPLRAILHTVPLQLSDWLVALGLSALPALIGQGSKWLREKPLRQSPRTAQRLRTASAGEAVPRGGTSAQPLLKR